MWVIGCGIDCRDAAAGESAVAQPVSAVNNRRSGCATASFGDRRASSSDHRRWRSVSRRPRSSPRRSPGGPPRPWCCSERRKSKRPGARKRPRCLAAPTTAAARGNTDTTCVTAPDRAQARDRRGDTSRCSHPTPGPSARRGLSQSLVNDQRAGLGKLFTVPRQHSVGLSRILRVVAVAAVADCRKAVRCDGAVRTSAPGSLAAHTTTSAGCARCAQ